MDKIEKMDKSGYFVIHLYVIVELLCFFLIPYIGLELDLKYIAMAGWTVGFITPSVGLFHELIHLRNKKWYTKILYQLMQIFSGIWWIEQHHLFSHHPYGNTENDMGHPSRNKNRLTYIYEYVIEPIIFFGLRQCKYKMLATLLVTIGLYMIFGWHGVVYQLMTNLGFYFTTGSGNYVQHYGLDELPLRDEEKGKYAWDDFSLLGYYFGFNLHIHSHHHCDTYKPFDKLGRVKGRPTVPYGTPLMMVLLMLPLPLFHKIMNKRLDRYLKNFKNEEIGE